MKTTFIYLTLVCSSFLLSSNLQSQTDTSIVEEEIIYDIDEAMLDTSAYEATEFIYEEPSSDWTYEEPAPRKWDFQTKFGYGFNTLSSSLSPVGTTSPTVGRYLPKTKMLSSSLSYFELSFGKNLHKGMWRLWFGLGIEDEYHTFEDASVRMVARSDSFGHYTVDPNATEPLTGKDEKAESSSISFTTVSVPIAIGYQNHARRPKYKIQAGAYVGYRFQTTTQVEYSDGTKLTIDGDFHANSFIIDPFVSIQYKRIGAFFRTSITPLFKNTGTANEQTRTAIGIFLGV